MTHDPLCPLNDEQWPKHPLEKCHYCDLIANVRQDMLAECIAAVDALEPETQFSGPYQMRRAAIDTLRALQEKP
jgi:hypothetical protein